LPSLVFKKKGRGQKTASRNETVFKKQSHAGLCRRLFLFLLGLLFLLLGLLFLLLGLLGFAFGLLLFGGFLLGGFFGGLFGGVELAVLVGVELLQALGHGVGLFLCDVGLPGSLLAFIEHAVLIGVVFFQGVGGDFLFLRIILALGMDGGDDAKGDEREEHAAKGGNSGGFHARPITTNCMSVASESCAHRPSTLPRLGV